jgi:DNA modification methylase
MGKVDEYRNKIIYGDATEVLKSLPDECVDCVITSPPYNR